MPGSRALLLASLVSGILCSILPGLSAAESPREAAQRSLKLRLVQPAGEDTAPEPSSAPVEVYRFETGSALQGRFLEARDFSLEDGGGTEPPGIVLPCLPGVHWVRWGSRSSFSFLVEEDDCRSPTPREVSLYPAGSVRGRLALPARLDPPSGSAMQLRKCEVSIPRSAWRLPVPASIESDGAWEAFVPEACSRAALLSGVLAPVEIDVEASSEKAAAERREKPAERSARDGVPVTVLLDDAAGRVVPLAEVSVVPVRHFRTLLDSYFLGEPDSGLAVTGLADARGGFRTPALVPGRYYLLAGASGEFPTAAGPVDVGASGRPPVWELEVRPEARVDLELGGSKWSPTWGLTLQARRTADEVLPFLVVEKPWENPDQPLPLGGVPPGDWEFRLGAWSGGGFQAVAEGRRRVRPGDAVNVALRPSAVEFRGRVLARDEPIHGKLKVYGIADGLPKTAEYLALTDADGSFRISLPGPGLYRGEVFTMDNGFLGKVPDLEFLEPAEPVLVSLPEQEIDGTVMTEDGEPASGARIRARMLREGTRRDVFKRSTRVEPGGSFRLSALNEGRWVVRALGDGVASRAEVVELEPGGRETVELVLRPGRTFAGRVVNGQGLPIAGARGGVWGLGADPADTTNRRGFVTDERGGFEVLLTPDVGAWLNLQVWAEGHGATARRLRVAETGVVVTVRRGDAVHLYGGGIEWRGVTMPGMSLLGPDGAFLPLPANVENRGSVFVADPFWEATIPNLSPGRWRLFDIDFRLIHQLLAGNRDDVYVVTTFTASSLGETRVRVPAPPKPATTREPSP